MKLFVLFFVLLATKFSIGDDSGAQQTQSLILNDPNHYDEKFNLIQKNAEEFYKTLPQSITEDANLTVPELIVKYNYPMEIHTVVVDGYILEMHRIPWGRKGPQQVRPAVYLQHGLLSSSADWVISGPDNGLAYILADAGYDVWLPNLRGSRYSRKHETLDPDKNAKKFWDFTWHEMSVSDVPALIDYVIAETVQEKIFYIGHSQGTTNFYVMCAERPEYNNKIKAMFSLAPVGYTAHASSPILKSFALFEPWFNIVGNNGFYEYVPDSKWLSANVNLLLCGSDPNVQLLCTNSLFATVGFNKKQINTTLIPVIMGHTPSGASVKQIRHYAQGMLSRRFRQWDYGFFQNLKMYGSSRPPSYDLKKVKAPIYMFYSKSDWVSNEKDVKKLFKKLPNVVDKFLTTKPSFAHADYLYGIDAPRIIYDKILSLMTKY